MEVQKIEKQEQYEPTVIMVSGAGAVGKGTIVEALTNTSDLVIQKVIRYTTRQKGENEVNGVEYNFITDEEFEIMIARGELVEYQRYKPGYYGTNIQSVISLVYQGVYPVLDLDPDAAYKLKVELEKRNIRYLDFFVIPVRTEDFESEQGVELAIDVIKNRMRKRSRHSDLKEGVIEGRVLQARRWLQAVRGSSALIIPNPDGDISLTIATISNIIRNRPKSDNSNIEEQ